MKKQKPQKAIGYIKPKGISILFAEAGEHRGYQKALAEVRELIDELEEVLLGDSGMDDYVRWFIGLLKDKIKQLEKEGKRG